MKKLLLLFILFSAFSYSQNMDIKYHGITGDNYNAYTKVDVPDIYKFKDAMHKIKTASLSVQFSSNFPSSARSTIDTVINILSYLINSTVEIKIKANWTKLQQNVLGQAMPVGYLHDFTGAVPHLNYPYALANYITRQDLVPDSSDVNFDIDSTIAWYRGTDGNTPANQYDLESVALHEICHALGIAGSFSADNSLATATWGFNNTAYPTIYDSFIQYGGVKILSDTSLYQRNSSALYNVLTSNNITFSGTNAYNQNGYNYAKIYSPNPFESGSSISHLDKLTYFNGDPNSLMRPSLAMAEAIHSPGPVGLAILQDVGWSINSLITITFPNNNSTWSKQNNPQKIVWYQNFNGPVDIYLYQKTANGYQQYSVMLKLEMDFC